MYRNCGEVSVQESWLNDFLDDSLISLHNFGVHHQDCSINEKKWGAGVNVLLL